MSSDTISKAGGNAPNAGPAELARSINTERRLARLESLLAERQGSLPLWIRPPKSGPEHYTGFSRAKLYDGALKAHFRSVSIREPGQVKGTRLFLLSGAGGVLDYIARCEADAVKAAAEGSAE